MFLHAVICRLDVVCRRRLSSSLTHVVGRPLPGQAGHPHSSV